MKSRSHRLPVTNPQDDWVDGSWTVDCVCGVNFDDGEEMVNCDECGVWVHTRCVRYVKSEKLFACDKCKNKVRRNDSEETEVAQLLVELPTKTLRMNPPYHNTSVPIRRPFTLWTELPMEERVHVQGVPGGDPALFTGSSSVFGPELWKCSGYVPKKFNFQYREFPCWENETREAHDDNTSDKVNDVAAGNGAGALFSLSKENRLFTPVVNPIAENLVIASNNAIDSDATIRSMNGVKKDTVLPGPSVLPGSKRKKEEFEISKDRSGRKKSKIVEKEGYLKKDAHASRPDRGPMAVKTDIQRSKSGNSQEVQPAVDILEGPRVVNHATAGYPDTPTSSERLSKVASDVSKHCSTSEAYPREDKIRNHVPARVKDSHVENGGAATISERRDSSSLPLTDEVVTNVTDDKEEVDVRSLRAELQVVEPVIENDVRSLRAESQVVEPVIENVTCLGPDIRRHQNVENWSDNKVICSSEHDTKLPAEVHADGKLDITKSLPKLAGTSSGSMPEKAETNTTTIVVNSENSDCKLERGDRRAMNGDNNSNNGHKQSLKLAEDSPRSSLAAENPLSAQNQRKVVVIKENQTSSKSHNHDFSGRLSSPSNKRGSSRDEEKCERLKKKLKELPRSSGKRTVSEAKESVLNSCAKTSTGRSNSATSRSAESSSASLQSESTSHVPNKTTGSQLAQKGEKSNQTSSQPSSKVNTHLMQPPSSAPAALSDEELALLLHQELNSSPRVPRVPRMRHAGSLPQLTSPTATSMLMKRTLSSGAKDHSLTARRKSKDIGKDGSNCSQEVQETKKSERSSSPGCRREEDSVAKSERDSGSAKRVQSLKKSNDLAPNTSASGVANEQNLSAADDTKVAGHASHRTLPGLLAEIMSKGERMTYEELCNAVLPHWPNLRKHNGERYAYSSHSQAVLDCLRNRSEWACLVDRGPKTTTSRKRRKHDADSSEDNDDCMDRSVKKDVRNKTLESNQEEFPKGKRKARKRRRLALQGRRIKDVRRRHRAEVVSEEETESSESDEDSMFSEDEVQGGEAGNEASASSDEQATML